MIYFTSDNHFSHKKILEYCPGRLSIASTVEEMNRVMIERWNARVKPEDIVCHLGDFGFGSKEGLRDILKTLNGTKVLILGNHDRSATAMMNMGFTKAAWKHVIDIPGQPPILLNHIPSWAPDYKLQLHGHSHEEWKEKVYDNGCRYINVGVDVRDFEPKTLAELL